MSDGTILTVTTMETIDQRAGEWIQLRHISLVFTLLSSTEPISGYSVTRDNSCLGLPEVCSEDDLLGSQRSSRASGTDQVSEFLMRWGPQWGYGVRFASRGEKQGQCMGLPGGRPCRV